jgi:hypothetical protein
VTLALVLAWAALAQAPAAPSARAPLTASVRGPAAAAVGQPFELEVELVHQAGRRPTLQAGAAGDAWAVLAEHGSVTRPGPGGERETTTVRWTVVALEAGADARPELLAAYADGSLEAPLVAPGGIDVAAALAPGEDAPRPLHGFRSPAAGAGGWRWWHFLALGGIAAAASGLALCYSRRRHRKPGPAPPPTPLERLAAIDPRALAGPAEVQAAHYAITAAVRAAFDARLGFDRDAAAGRTDEEWLAAARASGKLAASEGDLLADLLRACAAVKYGGARPTHWAVQETLERARALLAGAALAPVEVAP